MTRRKGYRRRRSETTLALINVVFLMLVFFMVAGRIAAGPPKGLGLVRLHTDAPAAPADTLAVTADGTMLWKGAEAGVAAYLAGQPAAAGTGPVARVMPDRDLPAARLIEIATALRAAGAGEVRMVAEKTGP